MLDLSISICRFRSHPLWALLWTNQSCPTVDGQNPAPLGNHGKPLFVGIYRRIIPLGPLCWCRISSIHSMGGLAPNKPTQHSGARATRAWILSTCCSSSSAAFGWRPGYSSKWVGRNLGRMCQLSITRYVDPGRNYMAGTGEPWFPTSQRTPSTMVHPRIIKEHVLILGSHELGT